MIDGNGLTRSANDVELMLNDLSYHVGKIGETSISHRKKYTHMQVRIDSYRRILEDKLYRNI